jgi:hypothetical protein
LEEEQDGKAPLDRHGDDAGLRDWICHRVGATGCVGTLISVSMSSDNGPNITGFVDTTADKFTISAWTNQGTTDAWTPSVSSLPIVLTAQAPAGASFDVPDNFSGNVGSAAGYGFFLPIGTFSESITWTQGTLSTAQTSFGWGGFRSTPTFYALEGPTEVGYIPAFNPTFGKYFIDIPLNIQLPEPSSVLAASAFVVAGCRRRRQA